MSADGLPRTISPEPDAPTASLTMVRVQRRRTGAATPPDRKRGDLTQDLMEPSPKAAAPQPVFQPPSVPKVEVASPPSTQPLPPEPTAEPSFRPVADSHVESLPQPDLIEIRSTLETDPEPLPEPGPAPVEERSFADSDAEPSLESVDASPVEPVAEPKLRLVVDTDAPVARIDYPDAIEPEPTALDSVDDHYQDPHSHDQDADTRYQDHDHPQEVAALPQEPGPRSTEDLIDYWDGLAGERVFPAFAELDRSFVAECWPNSVLLTFGASEMPKITRLGDPDGEVEYNGMVTEWILSRGGHAAHRADALEETQRFPVSSGNVRYRLVLLPCSNDGRQIDHVLCHVSRLHEPKLSAAAAFKRWLAS
jgi:hypothetical protein